MRGGSRVFLAGDYLGTFYIDSAITTGFAAAQHAASLCGTIRQQAASRPRVAALPATTPREELPMTNNLRGVLVALATPATTEGALDETALRALVDRTIDGGVHGVVACGSTGEFTALTTDERRRVVEVVVDQTAGRVPVVAQTGDTSAAKAIALTRHAQAAGVDVVMPVAPYYEAVDARRDRALPPPRRGLRPDPGDGLQPAARHRCRPQSRDDRRPCPRDPQHPLREEHQPRHGPGRSADPRVRRPGLAPSSAGTR